jgi:hypothetical protein
MPWVPVLTRPWSNHLAESCFLWNMILPIPCQHDIETVSLYSCIGNSIRRHSPPALEQL